MSSTSDEKQPPQKQGGEQGRATGTAAAPQSEAEGSSADRAPRHGRGRRRGGRSEQRQSVSQQQRRSESGLDMDELRELTELFTSHALTEFEFENADIRIRLSRNPAPSAAASAPAPTAAAHNALAAFQSAASTHAHDATQPSTPAATAPAPEAAAAPEVELHIITSPIVGTFYRSPSPQADVFIKPGSKVEHDTVVCIIEAMKLMNEIQAETTGTVEKIYVENGQPVEYGQPLFGIKK
jgi:acetyl-CoA carboxylase biotin carboxyl carrier protein